MKRFRKKPVVIEAIRFNGLENIFEISKWVSQRILRFDYDKETIVIETLEGDMIARKGDWIIKGIKDEFYPCAPDIFEATYEEVD